MGYILKCTEIPWDKPERRRGREFLRPGRVVERVRWRVRRTGRRGRRVSEDPRVERFITIGLKSQR